NNPLRRKADQVRWRNRWRPGREPSRVRRAPCRALPPFLSRGQSRPRRRSPPPLKPKAPPRKFSCDPNVAHHARFLVLDDVAVKHPVARIVRDERHVEPFPRLKQNRVRMMDGEITFVRFQDLQTVPMEVNRVLMRGEVLEFP